MGQKNSKQNKINRRDTAKINTRNIFHDAVDLEDVLILSSIKYFKN